MAYRWFLALASASGGAHANHEAWCQNEPKTFFWPCVHNATKYVYVRAMKASLLAVSVCAKSARQDDHADETQLLASAANNLN